MGPRRIPLLFLLLLLVPGCASQGLVWERDRPRASEWRLWGKDFRLMEAWVEDAADGPVLCANFYDTFGSGPDEARWEHWRYRLSDGKVLLARRPGRGRVPAAALGDYARGWPSNWGNIPLRAEPPEQSAFVARAAGPDVEIVERHSGRVASRIPDAEVHEQDGKGDLLVVMSRVDHGPESGISERGMDTYFLRAGRVVLHKRDMRADVLVLRGGEEPVVSCGDLTWDSRQSYLWLGQGSGETKIRGEGVVAYKQWLVTNDLAGVSLCVYDLTRIRRR